MAEVRRDRARALARVSFGIGAAFICMHQAGKNKRIRACVSGALFVIQFVARGIALFHERNASLLLGSQGRGSDDNTPRLRNAKRWQLRLSFLSLERLSRPVRRATPFPFYSPPPLFSNCTLILEISPIYSLSVLNNCAPNAATELLISRLLKKYFKRVFFYLLIYYNRKVKRLFCKKLEISISDLNGSQCKKWRINVHVTRGECVGAAEIQFPRR